MSTRWPLVVGWLLETLPTLPGWSDIDVCDGSLVTYSENPNYAIVGHSGQDAGAGNYVRQIDPSMLIDEAGTVRTLVVTRSGDIDPAGVRSAGFVYADALEAALVADQTLGGVLGSAGTASVAVDVQTTAEAGGATQALIISVNYSSLTP